LGCGTSATGYISAEMITLTEAAATHLRALLDEKGASPEEKGLRLLVENGGCAGMQYAMRIDETAEGDTIIERDGVRVFVDTESLTFLDGSELDYLDALNDSGFKINNPNAARSCGCGTSFEPANEDQAPSYDPSQDGTVCGSDADTATASAATEA
jgi:iron-sulfur cluster assembly accessory protein